MSTRARALPVILLAALGVAPPAAAGLFSVAVENGSRQTTLGDTVAYDLYWPVSAASQPAPPWPTVVLNHGFSRDKSHHADNARYLAARGIVVLVPNLVSLLGGEDAQLRNIANTEDHVAWLKARTATPGDALFGLVDRARIGLAGHSAGGAIAFEAAVGLGPDVEALLLLDAVPWSRTLSVAGALEIPYFASLRSDPSACNAAGSVVALLSRLAFPSLDVRLVGATHCDPENPTDLLCAFGCGGTSATRRSLYQRLQYLFLQDALGVPSVESPPDTYGAALLQGLRETTLVITPVSPRP